MIKEEFANLLNADRETEHTEFKKPVFSHYFVNEGILDGLADEYNQLQTTDENVAVEEAFDYAKAL